MAVVRKILFNQNALAWAALMVALGLHVIDEALTDFLPFYNHVVRVLQERFGFFPMPTFSFDIWLGGLIFLILLGFALTPLVARGGRVMRVVTTLIGGLMVFNALGHMLWSACLGRLLPGFWSSPILLVASLWVAVRGTRRESWQRKEPTTLVK